MLGRCLPPVVHYEVFVPSLPLGVKQGGIMSKGISLHLGLNTVSPDHYQGWDGELNACEADSDSMAQIAKSQGFGTAVMKTTECTRIEVAKRIEAAAKELVSGDIFFLTYSGHGGHLPDLNGDEEDGHDETWCLYDGELVDDELYRMWGKFAAGVRILMTSDSCHSGSVARTHAAALRATGALEALLGQPGEAVPRSRSMPPEVARRTYEAHRNLYDPILAERNGDKNSRGRVKASVMLLSGCQDNQESLDGTFNGLFTAKLLRTWRGGKFAGNYREFLKTIVRLMPNVQTPNYFTAGAANPNFEAQKPFMIA
jgi:hypothetical protein